MPTQRLEIEIRAEGDQAAKHLEKLGKAADKSGQSLGLLDGVMVGVGLRAADMATQFLRSVPELVDLGVEAGRAEIALEAYAGSAAAAERATQAVVEATDGAVSNLEATRQASRFMAMGLAETADEAGKLAEIAVTLGASMGKGPQQAFEEFALLLANQSIPRLDTFGISAGRTRERINELQEANEGMSRETAFMTAVMEEAEGKLEELEAAGFEATNSIDQLRAEVENAKVGVATFLAEGLVPWIDGIRDVRYALGEHSDALVTNSDTYEDYLDQIGTVELVVGRLTEEQFELAKAEEEAAEQARIAEASIRDYGGEMQRARRHTDELASSGQGLKQALLDTSEAAIAKQAIEALDAAYEEGVITLDEYNDVFIEISTKYLDVPAKQIVASRSIQELMADFEAGKITAGELAEAVGKLNAEINGLENKEITIGVEFKLRGQGSVFGQGGIGGIPEFQGGGQFIVPPGFNTQAFLMGVHSGERVTVEPAGNVHHDNRQYNLAIHTSAPYEPIVDDFKFMESRLS